MSSPRHLPTFSVLPGEELFTAQLSPQKISYKSSLWATATLITARGSSYTLLRYAPGKCSFAVGAYFNI